MADAFIDYVMELLGPFGTVRTRRMFGGYGVYLDGLMFAIVMDDTLYLKADAMNRAEFEQAGCERFTYTRKGVPAALGFYRAPDGAMESPEPMLPWARTAYAAALRANAKRQAAAQARAVAQREPPRQGAAPARKAKKTAARPAHAKKSTPRPR